MKQIAPLNGYGRCKSLDPSFSVLLLMSLAALKRVKKFVKAR